MKRSATPHNKSNLSIKGARLGARLDLFFLGGPQRNPGYGSE